MWVRARHANRFTHFKWPFIRRKCLSFPQRHKKLRSLSVQLVALTSWFATVTKVLMALEQKYSLRSSGTRPTAAWKVHTFQQKQKQRSHSSVWHRLGSIQSQGALVQFHRRPHCSHRSSPAATCDCLKPVCMCYCLGTNIKQTQSQKSIWTKRSAQRLKSHIFSRGVKTTRAEPTPVRFVQMSDIVAQRQMCV